VIIEDLPQNFFPVDLF